MNIKEIEIKKNISSYIDFNSYIGKEIELTGMIQNLRILSWGAFLILRLPNYIIQTVIDKNKIQYPLENLSVESTVKIKGIVQNATIKDNSINPRFCEILVTDLKLISSPSINPLPIDTTKKELNVSLDTKFDLRPLSLRHPKQRAIFKISSIIFNEFGNFLTQQGFTRICSPKIVFSGAEGGANIFNINYFEKKAFLAQSPQFYKQMMVGVFGRVFETAPVFRAEKHDSSRHLNEYISLDIEMALENGYEDLILVETLILNHILEKIKTDCQNEIELLGITLPEITKIYTVKFSDVKDIIYKKYNKDYREEKDLSPEEERLISDFFKKEYNTEFVFVTHYPTEKRPFYAMSNPENPEETLSFDLLFRGLEITTGGQRLHKYEDYINKMTKLGMNIESFKSYLQAFQYGMPPHGGFGLGLERITASICNLTNVKEASLFPRDINRLEP
ncbi:MAG TPA: aspartate--tRNA(Asn) ligase [Spirochaetota bacterium]|nr:aspartate--tRNA(Asn) ligase [Spirochaetota bacterium]HOL57801.1 aspartate--tRNA(Asn) ligase [Spirochaetota bacterium]HPP04502.1 aspartate--tRNA(Asn) ligase [Spirochaetota bacterium]